MDWTMGDEAVKVQLFRFIDALPHCTSPETITPPPARILRRGPRSPARLGTLRLALAAAAGLARQPARLDGPRQRRAVWPRKFIAGSNLDEALAAVDKLRRAALAFTVDLLGEATITEAEAEQ